MRRLILFAVCLIAALSFAGFHQWKNASADEKFAPGCGESSSSRIAYAWDLVYGSGHFQGFWQQTCGIGDTSVEVEVQRSTDGGAHWNDVVCCGGAVLDLNRGTTDTSFQERVVNFADSACGSGKYRFKVYDANHSTTTLLNGDGHC